MLRSRGRFGAGRALAESTEVDINMAPLIDMIFILLIFFLVTASFVRESGVTVQRPEAASAAPGDAVGLMIGVTTAGEVFVDGRPVELRNLRAVVALFLMENPGGGVLIEADRACSTGRLVAVLDQCRLAGAENTAVSAVAPSP
ncbi:MULTISPECIES: ExbD/TolR family protein [Desulfococcus]|uniref:Biopolymer transport protein ExbD/TolR n=1 Tax=Desulfococcus multivorans DSM 2059 TaxID=1121405 RepID=S7TRY0_DESML|nr:biopolymer transporter ExbD [Desulfococcus multivorans]AOY57159.1 ExbD: biopolymer transport protein [Desulfococcus multivorans]AQU99648.1 biopolymer transporter ExbD [Desulfococcus multivorans]EPR39912.1 Biopolymer transport protein ExbD/TolR [Desulfococcus multivorans DSM 2059]SKA23019.1 outer membrane transport energization protein ExbD [Desulfococcus multivorans DSM 2059]